MLRRRQQRGLMWVAGTAMGLAAAVTWWVALKDSAHGTGLLVPFGLTGAALIWFVNALVAQAARAREGTER
jgi:hypothetical protein